MTTEDASNRRAVPIASRWSSILYPSLFFIFAVSAHNLMTSHQSLIQGYFPSSSSSSSHHRSVNHSSRTETSHERLNVLILYPDDWRHDTLGKEKEIVHTPFLNSLADAGIRFTHNCVTTSICWISRATFFTGQYASEHESFRLYCPNFIKKHLWAKTWPGLLRDAGNYFVGHVGKWQYHSHPCDDEGGFDHCSIFEGQHWYQRFDPETGAHERLTGSEAAKRDAVRFLRTRPRNRKFALTVAFYPPKAVGSSSEPGAQWTPDHANRAVFDNKTVPEPYNMTDAFDRLPDFLRRGAARGRWRERYATSEHYQESMKNYYALVSQVDKACEEIVNELEAQGVLNETLVIFTTDNGMFHGSHGLAGKWYPYQESIRVPLILRDPRLPKHKIGTTDDSLTLNVDLAQTILGAAGVDAPPSMQGRNVADVYLPGKNAVADKPWRDEFFYEFDVNDNGIPASTALVRKTIKYVRWPKNDGHEQLFDLTKDPLELDDVKAESEYAAILNETKRRHDELRDEIQKPNRTDDEKIGCVQER